ncbi:mannosyloligosaccharid alpha-mannosidase [Martensiomyces pterosporus]|nr:mannosyloligosaccharid alpha-mannosidase [Martensiomyces pterosporus]
MKHAWDGYRQYAFGMDELQPVTNGSNNKWGGWGVTLIDALDTLYIMDLFEEFNEGAAHVATLNFSAARKGYTTPFFEMVIRSLAGLLTSYEMSLDRRLLKKAQEVGDVLFPAFNTTTGIPYPRVDVNSGQPIYTSKVCIAEAGTVQLEYWKLSELTGNKTYHEAAQRVVDVLDKADKPYKGLYPIWVDIQTGAVSSGQITFGGQGDSWYEYMLKQYLYSRQTNDQYRRMYEESIDSMKEKMVKTSIYDPQMAYIGDLDSTATRFNPKFQHLTCFVPGMLALGSKPLNRPDDLELAKKLAYTCYQMYNRTDTGLGAEYVLFRDSNDLGISANGFYFGYDRSYILRPETIESLMILYRVTGDEMYKEWGWSMFLAIEKWTKTPAAYSAYGDVTSTEGKSVLTDSMESFFLAETLKYLYLLFSPVDYYSLDEFVFNTEAHPFRILRSPRP